MSADHPYPSIRRPLLLETLHRNYNVHPSVRLERARITHSESCIATARPIAAALTLSMWYRHQNARLYNARSTGPI
jgi:hypothetical protein